MSQATWTALLGFLSASVAGVLAIWKMNVAKTVSADKDFITMYNELMKSNNKLIEQNAELTAELQKAHASIEKLTQRIKELENKLENEH
ncbi:hypothetical protein [Weissella paramesenteroides]|uniref:hypothetical protein n=1 Tax=Weissella paramesenteroides TaxID=1249 RepID=UPI001238E8F8|nr:hypothetical protein [Weissella paramesenteroides]KAA8455668.1 hypothetical protein FKV86_06475 [Weissella paramesenteroides]KAA8459628.1 hypothetical protein FKV78_00585 [Weissella paramesenteroides]KAA8461073.1 hypothetical protein FKV82_00280 [Weissella paramesenteroides]KAA8462184.1 hypothetical protein FKV80_05525 [Weissella paramesenteroides]KAA8465305.1 hypothetical protein FKV83_02755 [Weissella paramesenteroides]